MALIVTGVHRSGTSMIAGLLSKLEIPMGEGAVMNAAPENPEGFFERIDVMQLNDSVLKRLGGSWQAPPNLGPESWFSIDQNALAHYRSSIDLFSGRFNSWFVKDPRISLILPIWDRLALTNLSLIFAVRNPQSVAQSLHLRNGLSHRRAFAIWWAYNQQLLTSVDSRDTLFIDYDSAKRSKKATTEKIASFALKAVKISAQNNLDSNMGNFEEDRILDSLKIKKAEQSINSKLSRSSSTKLIKGLSRSEIDETMDLYAALKKLHASSSTKLKKVQTPDWVYEELQSARVEFQLSQTIENLYDHLETSKIEIATLNQQAQSTLHTQNEELEGLRTRLITTEAEKESAQSQALHLHNESERQRKELELAQSSLQSQSEVLDRLNARLITTEAEKESAQSQALHLHNESERQRKELELAQSSLHSQSEVLDRLNARLITTEAEKESAQSQALHLHNESERQRKELELAQSSLQSQSEVLDRLNARLITTEAEKESAQSQALHLHNESERQRKELELAQSTLDTQNEELDDLKAHLITTQAHLITAETERDIAQSQVLVETAKVKKSADALSAVSVELADRIAELNRAYSELAQSKNSMSSLQASLDVERLLSMRLDNQVRNQNLQIDELRKDIQRMTSDSSESKLRISILDEHVSNLVKQLGIEILNNKNLEHESKLIKSSRGYRFVSKLWKIKG